MTKLKITEFTYGRVKNLGNYETERMEITCTVDEKEDAAELFKLARGFVRKQLNLKAAYNEE